MFTTLRWSGLWDGHVLRWSRPRRYFAKVLAQSKAGRDPFQAPPPPPRKRDVESFLDPDIREFETVLEGSRLYVLTALFIASQGASWVLLKVWTSLWALIVPK